MHEAHYIEYTEASEISAAHKNAQHTLDTCIRLGQLWKRYAPKLGDNIVRLEMKWRIMHLQIAYPIPLTRFWESSKRWIERKRDRKVGALLPSRVEARKSWTANLAFLGPFSILPSILLGSSMKPNFCSFDRPLPCAGPRVNPEARNKSARLPGSRPYTSSDTSFCFWSWNLWLLQATEAVANDGDSRYCLLSWVCEVSLLHGLQPILDKRWPFEQYAERGPTGLEHDLLKDVVRS